mgnify:CR=1 FL=1|jgi:hypothetical protein
MKSFLKEYFFKSQLPKSLVETLCCYFAIRNEDIIRNLGLVADCLNRRFQSLPAERRQFRSL